MSTNLIPPSVLRVILSVYRSGNRITAIVIAKKFLGTDSIAEAKKFVETEVAYDNYWTKNI